ncbi:MAG: hypothetical protein G01um1014106_373 [Parcubacteria group bacterium Gr01-1014_106]|nr:MAG: hypothetical protein G01um1014106_373 [Parcubacteria group bacterium Gr01-1014_106]
MVPPDEILKTLDVWAEPAIVLRVGEAWSSLPLVQRPIPGRADLLGLRPRDGFGRGLYGFSLPGFYPKSGILTFAVETDILSGQEHCHDWKLEPSGLIGSFTIHAFPCSQNAIPQTASLSPSTTPGAAPSAPASQEQISGLEGRWEGKTSAGPRFTWIILADGTYTSEIPARFGIFGQRTGGRKSGKIWVQGGQIRWSSEDQRGTLTVHEEGGQRILRGFEETHRVTFELVR